MTTYKIGVEASSTHTIEAESVEEALEQAKQESPINGHNIARTLVLDEEV